MFPIQPAGPAAAEPLTAAEAALRLGVSRSTLYAYVSRGLLQAVANPDDPRRSLYAVHEVALLLRRRGRSRRPAAQALAALAEGLPLLETAVAGVVDGQPHYRGRPALPWARRATLEDTARLLWHAEPHDRIVDLLVDPFAGPAPVLSAAWRRALRDTSGQPPAERTLALLALALPDLPAPPWGADEATVLRACGALLRVAMACFLGVTPDASPLHLQCQRAWGLPDAAAQPLREALVLGAENELNLPAFTARTVGSVGAPLGATMLAGLCNITARFTQQSVI